MSVSWEEERGDCAIGFQIFVWDRNFRSCNVNFCGIFLFHSVWRNVHYQSTINCWSEQTNSIPESISKVSIRVMRLIPKDISPENRIRVPELLTHLWKFCPPSVLNGSSVSYSASYKCWPERSSCSWVNTEGCSNTAWLPAVDAAMTARGVSLAGPCSPLIVWVSAMAACPWGLRFGSPLSWGKAGCLSWADGGGGV